MEQIVHIIPLGWEIDRAVIPLRTVRPNKVYLLCNPESHPYQMHFFKQVVNQLDGQGILYKHVTVDSDSDIKGLVHHISRIIREEIEAGNRVYVNISASGKIGAVAAALASMAHLSDNGKAYYVRPENYHTSEDDLFTHGLSMGMKADPLEIPLFRLKLPSAEGRLVLNTLKNRNGSASYQDLFCVLARAGVDGYLEVTKQTSRKIKGNLTVRLTKTILRPLVEAGLITIERRGRRALVKITEAGDYMACLVGN